MQAEREKREMSTFFKKWRLLAVDTLHQLRFGVIKNSVIMSTFYFNIILVPCLFIYLFFFSIYS